jgi:DNA-binding CsgD family transcriptional regulator/PAS domain-containing protein
MQMTAEETFDNLIRLAYRTAEDPAAWQQFGDAVCDAVGARASEISIFRHDTAETLALSLPRLRESQARERAENFVPRSPGIDDACGGGVTGAPAAGRVHIDIEELEHSDRIERSTSVGLKLAAGTACDLPNGDRFTMILHWGREDGPIDDAGLALLRRLTPHLRHAVTLGSTLDALQGKVDSFRTLLETRPLGIILLDEKARVIETNKRANALLERIPGFRPGNEIGSAVTRHAQIDAFFARAVDDSLPAAERTTALRLDFGRNTSLRLVCVPLDSDARGLFSRARPVSVVYALDCSSSHDLPRDLRVGALLGLSRRESQVATALYAGEPPKRIADQLDISEHTVRVFVRRVYQKLGINRQTQLVRLLTELNDVLGLPAL